MSMFASKYRGPKSKFRFMCEGWLVCIWFGICWRPSSFNWYAI